MDKKIITIIVLIILLVISFSLLVSEKTKSTTQGTELQYTYLLLKPSETMDSELNDCKQILTFDENDLCVDCRFLYDFKDELRAQEQYNTYMSNHEILIESNMEPGLFNIAGRDPGQPRQGADELHRPRRLRPHPGPDYEPLRL